MEARGGNWDGEGKRRRGKALSKVGRFSVNCYIHASPPPFFLLPFVKGGKGPRILEQEERKTENLQ